MIKLVLLRHGESEWNKKNRFTGWTDVDLSDRGRIESRKAARLLKAGGYSFDVAYTSLLRRTIRTLWIVLDGLNRMWTPIERSWRLNERHYGALQGRNKAKTAAIYGEEQVRLWRRSYDVRPPALAKTDRRYPGADPRYREVPESELPLAESLKDTVERFMPYWRDAIVPSLLEGKKAIVVAHGNSLRALVKHLDGISDHAIIRVNIPTGIPLVYELDEDLKAVRRYYLGDSNRAERAMRAVAEQGRA